MSSFRPDSDSSAPGFVASALERIAGFSAVVDFELSRDDATSASDGHDEPASDRGEDTIVGATEPSARFTAEDLEAAEQAGFDRGVTAVDAARQELERVTAALDGCAAELRTELEARWTEWIGAERETVIELASTIAENWVRGALQADGSALTAMLDAVLVEAADAEPERLYLAAADLDRLKSEQSDGRIDWEPTSALEIESDLQLEPGEFRVALRRGWIDGRFEQVRRSLREHWADSADANPAHESRPKSERES